MSKKMLKKSLALGALMAFVITGQAWAAPVEADTTQIVIGQGDSANDPGQFLPNDSIVIGKNAQSTGWQGDVVDNIVIGEFATVRNSSTAMTFGWNAKVWESANGVAFGSESTVEAAAGAVAFGNRTYVNGANSVALGANSSTNEEGVISVGHQVGDKYYMGSGTVRNYTDTLLRKITNVADGENDWDVATVGQMKAADEVLATKIAGISRTQYNDTTTGETKVTDDFVVDTQEGNGSVTIGYIGEDEMFFTTNEEGKYTFGINAQTGAMQANGGAEIGKREDGSYNVQMNKDGVAIQSGVSVAGGLFDVNGATGKVVMNIKGSNGNFTVKDIEGSTMFYGKNADNEYTVGINAQTGGIESKHINVGDGAFVANEKGAAVTGSLTVNGNAEITGGLTVGTDVVANGTSLKETAALAEANKQAIEANTDAINKNTQDIVTNASNIQANTEAIAANKTAIEKNASDIAANADAIAKETAERKNDIANVTNHINDVAKSVDDLNTAVEGVAADATAHINRVQEDLSSAIVQNIKDINAVEKVLDEEAKAREEGDNKNAEAIEANANAIANNSESISGLNQRLGKMNGKINKVGAGAAALAALHPLDYDPDDKLSFAAGVGNYAGETAAALGAFYRPDEKLMFSLGGTMGNGENMVNLGVSIGLDGAKGAPKLSKKELVQKMSTMEAENEAIKAENQALEERVAKLEALVAKLAEK